MQEQVMLQTVVDTHDQPFWVIASDLTVVAANRGCEQLFAIEAGGLLGRHCYELMQGRSAPCSLELACPHRRLLRDLLPYRETIKVKDAKTGESRWLQVRGQPIVAADGKVLVGEQLTPLPGVVEGVRIVGRSEAIGQLLGQLTRTAAADLPVLLVGETGTGKELAAQYLHGQSMRRAGPFVTIDCTTLSEQLFEAELFGYEKGAFTGASGRKQGLFELAAGGTLFLDELGELPLGLQPKLLRALDTGNYRRVGGTEVRYASVRLVCATHCDLEAMVKAGTFRSDLYYRIRVARLRLPPLRERRQDLADLIEYFLADFSRCTGRTLHLSRQAADYLWQYHYPGNVRELRNLLQLGAALSVSGEIGLADIATGLGEDGRARSLVADLESALAEAEGAKTSEVVSGQDKMSPLQAVEANYIAELLQQESGDRGRVAEILGVSRRTLQRRIKRYRLGSLALSGSSE